MNARRSRCHFAVEYRLSWYRRPVCLGRGFQFESCLGMVGMNQPRVFFVFRRTSANRSDQNLNCFFNCVMVYGLP